VASTPYAQSGSGGAKEGPVKKAKLETGVPKPKINIYEQAEEMN
jgi:hypothetical protein